MSEADLKRLQLLSELQHGEREAIAEALEPLRLEAGTLLFDEGEQGEGALFLVDGDVELSSSRAHGRVVLRPGAAFGAFALVAAGPREARAETTSRAELLVLRRSAFRRFADQEPRAACRLLEAILRETSRLGREALALAGPAVDPPTSAD